MKRSDMTVRQRANLDAASYARTWLTKAHPEEYREHYLAAKASGLSAQRAQTRAKTRLVQGHNDLYRAVMRRRYDELLAEHGLERTRSPR